MEIGDNCLITEGVVILAHDYSFSVVVNAYHDIVRKQRITHIGNNVFIGMNSIILMGADIGDNVIIGAGSIVSGKVESNSVYAGNLAKKICSLNDYYKKLKSGYVESALIYASKAKTIEEMGFYRSLFESEENYLKYLKSKRFNGIDANTLEKIHIPTQKLKWEDINHL